MSLDLGEALVEVVTPTPPVFTTVPPEPSEVLILPVAGPRGAPGASGGVIPPFHQVTPAASWTWVHNLGRKPSIVILLDDDPQQPVYSDTFYIDENTLTVEFPVAVSGYLYI